MAALSCARLRQPRRQRMLTSCSSSTIRASREGMQEGERQTTAISSGSQMAMPRVSVELPVEQVSEGHEPQSVEHQQERQSVT